MIFINNIRKLRDKGRIKKSLSGFITPLSKASYSLSNKIYNDIDIFETISNITGMKIKKDELLFSEYPFLRKLVWWK